MAKGVYDITSNGGAKAIGYLKKLEVDGKTADAVELVKSAGVRNKNGNPLNEQEVLDFIRKADQDIKKTPQNSAI